MNNTIIKLLITLMLAVTMVACGGGGGGGKGEPTNIDQNPGNQDANDDTQGGQQDDDTQGGQQDDDQQSGKDDDTAGPTKKTGIFLGSVAGVGYRSDTHEGVTNSAGEFEYEPGETVTFFIGEVVLGEVHTPADEAADETTQVSVEGSDDEAFTTDFTFHNILNMLQFFLALDDDNNSDNGIVITPETAAKTEDLDNPILDFTMSLNEFEDFLSSIVFVFSNSSIVPVEDVLFGQNASPYAGIWTAKFTVAENNCGFNEGSVDQEYRSFIYDLGNTLPDLMGGNSLFLQIIDDLGVALVDLAVDDNRVSLNEFSFSGRNGTFSVEPTVLLISDDDKYMVGDINWRHDAISGLTFCTGTSTMELFSDFSGGTTPEPIPLPTEPTGGGCFGELTLEGDDTDLLGETYMPVQFNGNGSDTFFYWQIFDTMDNLQWYLMVTLRGDNLGTNDVIAVDFFGNELQPVGQGDGFVWSYSTNNNNGCITGDRRRCNVIVDDNQGLVTFTDLVLGGVTGVRMDGSAPPLVINGTLSKNRADHCTL